MAVEHEDTAPVPMAVEHEDTAPDVDMATLICKVADARALAVHVNAPLLEATQSKPKGSTQWQKKKAADASGQVVGPIVTVIRGLGLKLSKAAAVAEAPAAAVAGDGTHTNHIEPTQHTGAMPRWG